MMGYCSAGSFRSVIGAQLLHLCIGSRVHLGGWLCRTGPLLSWPPRGAGGTWRGSRRSEGYAVVSGLAEATDDELTGLGLKPVEIILIKRLRRALPTAETAES